LELQFEIKKGVKITKIGALKHFYRRNNEFQNFYQQWKVEESFMKAHQQLKDIWKKKYFLSHIFW
jgi:hypothetical protein